MFPAARIGDQTTHDMLVPSGVVAPAPSGPPMVLIEGMPAATVGCHCACTGAITGGVVHPPPPPPAPPPPFPKGSLTVLINNMPALRWTPAPDIGPCGAFIGDPKLAATRTVLIGG